MRLHWGSRLVLATIALAPLMWKVWRLRVVTAREPDNPEGLIALVGLVVGVPLLVLALYWLFAPGRSAIRVAQWLTVGYLLVVLTLGYAFVSGGTHGSFNPQVIPMVPGLHGFLACFGSWGLAKWLTR